MSRSRKKTPIHSFTTSESEKEDKRIMNRALRRKDKQLLASQGEEYVPLTKNDIMTSWDMDKDGKHYWKDTPPELMRK